MSSSGLRDPAVALLLTAATLTGAAPAYAQDGEAGDASYRTVVQGGIGYFSGDYGLPEDTDVSILSFDARRYLRRGEVRVSIPYLQIDGPADLYLIGGQAFGIPEEIVVGSYRNESGLGDIVVRGDYYLRYGTESTPWVIGTMRLKLPTGDEDRGLGTGSTDVELAVGIIQRVGRINWLADVGYTLLGDSDIYDDYDLENVLRLGAGLSVPFGSLEQHSVYAYLDNRSNVISGEEDRRSISFGVETSIDEPGLVRLSASVFAGLTDTSEDYGLYVTIGRRF